MRAQVIVEDMTAEPGVHLRCGFRAVGVHQRIGRMEGVWRDVVLLERRSPAVE